jgi:hypothetical protein
MSWITIFKLHGKTTGFIFLLKLIDLPPMYYKNFTKRKMKDQETQSAFVVVWRVNLYIIFILFYKIMYD